MGELEQVRRMGVGEGREEEDGVRGDREEDGGVGTCGEVVGELEQVEGGRGTWSKWEEGWVS